MDSGARCVTVHGVAILLDLSERLNNNHNHLYRKSSDPWLSGFRAMCGGGLLFSIRNSRRTSLIRWHLGKVWRQEGGSYVVQSLSPVRLFATPWTVTRQAFLSFTVSQSLLKLIHRVNDAIQPPHPLSSPSPPAFNLSQHQGLLQWVGSSHQMAKVLELQPQHQSFQWIFRTHWFDLLAVQGTLKSLFLCVGIRKRCSRQRE